MKHYVTIPAAHLKAAKNLAGDRAGFPMMAGPNAWFLHVEERTALILTLFIPGATCKTLPELTETEMAVSYPDVQQSTERKLLPPRVG